MQSPSYKSPIHVTVFWVEVKRVQLRSHSFPLSHGAGAE
jgi:hypothetical protein